MEVLTSCKCTKIASIYKNRAAGIEVYLANHPTYGDVAIKILDCSSDDSLHFYQKEGRIAKSIEHPSICTVFEQANIRTPSGYKYYIIMEQATSDLYKEIKKRTIGNVNWTEECVVNMLEQCVSALEHAQQHSVCHRDIKPHNILICQDGRIKLADFGSANEAIHDSAVQTLTLQGTPIYLSPELREYYVMPEQQRAHKPRYNPYKSDVYSLALTFIHLIQLQQAMDLTRLEGLEEATKIRVDNLEVSQTLKELLLAMLSKEEEMRPDFILLKEMLDAMLNGGITRQDVEPLAENYLLAPGEQIKQQPAPPQYIPPASAPVQPPAPQVGNSSASHVSPLNKSGLPLQHISGEADVLTPPNVLLSGVSSSSALRLSDVFKMPLAQQPVEGSKEEEQPSSKSVKPVGASHASGMIETSISIKSRPLVIIPEVSLQGSISDKSMQSHQGDIEPDLGQEPDVIHEPDLSPESPDQVTAGRCVICYSELDSTALTLPCGHLFCTVDCLEVLMLSRLSYFRHGFGELLCPLKTCHRSISMEYIQQLKYEGMTIRSYMRSKQSSDTCQECKHKKIVRTLECSDKLCDKCLAGWVVISRIYHTLRIKCSICKADLTDADSDYVASVANNIFPEARK